MSRLLRVLVLATLLCGILVIGSATTNSNTRSSAHACGTYAVPGSTVTFFEGANNINVSMSLWYNSCNSQNFASANITTGTTQDPPLVYVHRLSGPDGGNSAQTNFNCPSSGICNSPGIYSPNNKTQACFQDPLLIVCTDYF